MRKTLFALSFISALAFGQANAAPISGDMSDDDAAYAPSGNNDPIEPINRAIFKFNTVVDGVVLKPAAQIYTGIVPQWGRDRVSNILYNLTEPLTVANSALQGDGTNAFTALWRFIFNSTFGLLGTFDVASELGLKPHREDLGQTLAVWGWANPPYLVLPIMGPSNLRDALGDGVEFFADPVDNWALEDGQANFHRVVYAIDKRADLLPTTDHIDRTSLDRYTSYKSIYTQNRNSAIRNGE